MAALPERRRRAAAPERQAPADRAPEAEPAGRALQAELHSAGRQARHQVRAWRCRAREPALRYPAPEPAGQSALPQRGLPWLRRPVLLQPVPVLRQQVQAWELRPVWQVFLLPERASVPVRVRQAPSAHRAWVQAAWELQQASVLQRQEPRQPASRPASVLRRAWALQQAWALPRLAWAREAQAFQPGACPLLRAPVDASSLASGPLPRGLRPWARPASGLQPSVQAWEPRPLVRASAARGQASGLQPSVPGQASAVPAWAARPWELRPSAVLQAASRQGLPASSSACPLHPVPALALRPAPRGRRTQAASWTPAERCPLARGTAQAGRLHAHLPQRPEASPQAGPQAIRRRG